MSKCWIDNGALHKMRQEGMIHFPLETGGSLMGYRTKNGDVVIVDVTGSGPDAIHERYNFQCDASWIQKQINKVFDETDGMIHYLGDWHTHPGGSTELSDMDKKALKLIVDTPEAFSPCAIMVVLGFRCDKLGAYQYPEVRESMAIKLFDFEGVNV